MNQHAIASYSSPLAAPHGTVLIVDDDRAVRMMLAENLSIVGYSVLEAGDGRQALAALEADASRIDTIVLDREMPEMNGMQFIRHVKRDARYRHIPILMVTGHDNPEQVKEGLEAGVYYYLPKPVQMTVLKPLLDAAIRETARTRTLRRELRMHRNSFLRMEQSQFHLNSLSGAEGLACFLAYCYPEPDRAVHGLSALFVNAVEHGIADIGFARKGQLIANGTWHKTVEECLARPENRNRYAQVLFRRGEDGCHITVTDPGNGFNWREYLSYNPSRAQHKHGRGIAQALATSFDSITYNERGNEAIGFVAHGNPLVW